MAAFGDVRDVLVAAPHYEHDGHAYARSDLFTVRHELISALNPQPESVFEFGALVGYFLLTALEASPAITHVGWIDNETYKLESNRLCLENLLDYAESRGRTLDVFYEESANRCVEFGHADLVQVDGDHSYDGCLSDLQWAMELRPNVIFVDDYIAHEPVRRATHDFATSMGLDVETYETVNGLAVLHVASV